MPGLAEKILKFNRNLTPPENLPPGVEVMVPFQDDVVYALCQQFYTKYYNDEKPRQLILGINPGRFGGGVTGIPFTDPIKLREICGIQNALQSKSELSADFIYAMIAAYGGPAKFYSQFLFSSISPLGFTQGGKNLNYYDDKRLESIVKPFAIFCITQQLEFGLSAENCFCLGEGKNYSFLRKLNDEHSFFKKVIPLPHPRFIMQYRRKKIDEYVDLYMEALGSH